MVHINTDDLNSLIKRLPMLGEASEKALSAFKEYAFVKKVTAGESLAMEGSSCAHFFILLSGSVRVFKISESGREITLYHVNKNESCILTAFCVMSKIDFPAFAVAEQDLEMLLIPSHIMQDWINRHEIWREHMFKTLSIRLSEILLTLDKALFQPLDSRIADFIFQTAKETNSHHIKITHEKMARELGSSRVAVSRMLESFERNGILKLSRGKITIKDPAALKRVISP